MKSKIPFILRFFIDTSVFLIVLYLSAVLASFSVDRLLKWQYSDQQTKLPAEALNPEYLAEGVRNAKKEGYSPVFYPAEILYHRSLRKLVKDADFLPLGSQPYANVYICDEGSGLIRDKLDRMGYRNEDSIWKNANKIDVIIVGDSIVSGECVSREHTISAKLINNGLNTAALASGGSSPNLYASIQKAFIPKVQPKIVVTVFHPNDRSGYYGDIFYNHYSKAKRVDDYLIKEGSSLRLNKKSSVFFGKLQKKISVKTEQNNLTQDKYTKLFLTFINSRHWSLDGLLPLLKQYVPNTGLIDPGSKYAVDTAVSLCKEYGCTPIFVYVPNPPVWNTNIAAATYYSNLKNYLERKNQHFVDTKNFLWDLDFSSYSPNGLHPSEIGYNIIGDAILKKISEEKSK